MTAPRQKLLLIKYHYRLGDIIRCFPIARHFARHGWIVLFECLPQYHGIFEAISYARPVNPGGAAYADLWVDRVMDLQIWPLRFQAFRASGRPWMDFVYALEEDLAAVPREIVFDRMDLVKPAPGELARLDPGIGLVAPLGFSNADPVDVPRVLRMAHMHLYMTCKDWFILLDPQHAKIFPEMIDGHRVLVVKNLGILPSLIQQAAEVFTVNSAPAVIAGAVRKNYWHVPTAIVQDDWVTPNRTVVTS